MHDLLPKYDVLESAYDSNRRNHSALYLSSLVSHLTLRSVREKALAKDAVIHTRLRRDTALRMKYPNAGEAYHFFFAHILDFSLPVLERKPDKLLGLSTVADAINTSHNLDIAVTVNDFYRPDSGFAGFPIPDEQSSITGPSHDFLIAYRKVHELYSRPSSAIQFSGTHARS